MADTKEGVKEIAKLAETTDRFEDMAEQMKRYVEEFGQVDLNDEERNLLSVAYKNIVGTKRASFKILQSEYEKLNGEDKGGETDTSNLDVSQKKLAVIKMKNQVKEELHNVCNEVITLLDKYLLTKAEETGEAKVKVFYNKMKGDYFRYQVEVAEDTKERKEMSDKAGEAYEKADTIARENLDATDPILLGLALNYSVFYYEIKEDHESACNKAKSSFDAAFAKLDDVEDSGEVYKDTTLIMQLLRDNLTLWRSEEQQGQEDDL